VAVVIRWGGNLKKRSSRRTVACITLYRSLLQTPYITLTPTMPGRIHGRNYDRGLIDRLNKSIVIRPKSTDSVIELRGLEEGWGEALC